MKFILFLVSILPLALAVPSPAVLAKTMPRGGAAIGPLDGDLALKLSKTAATAYVAASASKYIAKETGGETSNVSAKSFTLILSILIHAISSGDSVVGIVSYR